MNEYLTADILFNTIALASQGSNALVLVVEGEDDQFILRDHVTEDLLLVMSTGGKPLSIEAARLARERGINGVKFLIDADYDALLYPERKHANVIVSQRHDLLMDFVCSHPGTVEHLIEVHSRGAERRGVQVQSDTWATAALALSAAIAPIRIANERHDLGLNLQNFPFGKLRTITPTVADFAAQAVGRSNTKLSTDEITDLAEAELSLTAKLPHEHLAGDHDYFRALARVLKAHDITAGADQLLASFLTSLTCGMLATVTAFDEIAAWCKRNSRRGFTCSPL